MSRNLPTYPNLDHLKKQAKNLLHALQQRNPGLKLADAQHAIAREYGFARWPNLKAHVESLTHSSAPAEAVDDESSGISVDAAPMGPEMAHPFVGLWTANLSKSRRHPGNQFQRATLEFAVAGDKVSIIDVVLDESGREERGENTILADGNEYPSESGNGYVLMTRWGGPRVIETVAKKDGQVVGRGTYEVSDDGKTMTISGDEQMIVLDHS